MGILRRYIFWTYERGSFHYDVMVTLILIFIFFSPLVIKYNDQPTYRRQSAGEVVVKSEGANSFVYRIDVRDIQAVGAEPIDRGGSDAQLRTAMLEVIQPLSGDVQLDRYEAVRDSLNRVIAYQVWAHR